MLVRVVATQRIEEGLVEEQISSGEKTVSHVSEDHLPINAEIQGTQRRHYLVPDATP